MTADILCNVPKINELVGGHTFSDSVIIFLNFYSVTCFWCNGSKKNRFNFRIEFDVVSTFYFYDIVAGDNFLEL